jgi:hypothetical protein
MQQGNPILDHRVIPIPYDKAINSWGRRAKVLRIQDQPVSRRTPQGRQPWPPVPLPPPPSYFQWFQTPPIPPPASMLQTLVLLDSTPAMLGTALPGAALPPPLPWRQGPGLAPTLEPPPLPLRYYCPHRLSLHIRGPLPTQPALYHSHPSGQIAPRILALYPLAYLDPSNPPHSPHPSATLRAGFGPGDLTPSHRKLALGHLEAQLLLLLWGMPGRLALPPLAVGWDLRHPTLAIPGHSLLHTGVMDPQALCRLGQGVPLA